ncbi:MAG: hypothetical protein IJJ52_03670 [Lachnospiraceae bacterium]|nr:hypothetical protein [Lachnospiraceae bacterium]
MEVKWHAKYAAIFAGCSLSQFKEHSAKAADNEKAVFSHEKAAFNFAG